MNSQSFYSHEPVSERVEAIYSLTGEILYLVKGSEKALLVDTSVGVQGLRELVNSLTELPLTVWITHGHVDHAMGAFFFRDVELFMNHADDAVLAVQSASEVRRGYLAGSVRENPERWAGAELCPALPANSFRPLCDGEILDLGGIHAEAYSLPGHTPGTMVVLIPEERILITGDAANSAVFLFDDFTSTVETYRENLMSAADRLRGRYDRCFQMHGWMEASGDLLQNLVRLCDQILAGDTDDVPFSFMGTTAFMAKAMSSYFRRLDGGEGNIIYNKEKVRNI